MRFTIGNTFAGGLRYQDAAGNTFLTLGSRQCTLDSYHPYCHTGIFRQPLPCELDPSCSFSTSIETAKEQPLALVVQDWAPLGGASGTFSAVPEPSVPVLLVLGLLGLLGAGRRR